MSRFACLAFVAALTVSSSAFRSAQWWRFDSRLSEVTKLRIERPDWYDPKTTWESQNRLERHLAEALTARGFVVSEWSSDAAIEVSKITTALADAPPSARWLGYVSKVVGDAFDISWETKLPLVNGTDASEAELDRQAMEGIANRLFDAWKQSARRVGSLTKADAKTIRRIPPRESVPLGYFPEIDKVSSRMGLQPLRRIKPDVADLELRVWAGFGIGGFEGFALRRVRGEWSALSAEQPVERRVKKRRVPPSRWADLWDALEREGLFVLRPAEPRYSNCDVAVFDGVSYVVEAVTGGEYRSFVFGNPEISRSEQGDNLLRALAVLYKAFGGWHSPADVASLPRGRDETVSSVLNRIPDDATPTVATRWVGTAPADADRTPVLHLKPEEALAQGTNLKTPQCRDLRPIAWAARATGTVLVEVRIDPSGRVFAARALSGHALLLDSSVEAALRWTFIPSEQAAPRSAILAIEYRRELVQYPWLK